MTESGLSPRTTQYTNMIFSQAMKAAVTWHLIAFNPCDGAKLPRQVRREMKVLDVDGVRRLMGVARLDREERWAPLFYLAVTTGMRPSEYLALKWPDIDLDRRIVSVQRSLDFLPGDGWEFSDCKKPRSRRTIKLHTDVVQLLREHKLAQEAERKQDWKETDLVFTTDQGTPLERANIRRALHRLIGVANRSIEDDRLKLPKIRLYDLRHTAATLALAAGVPVKVVQEMLGHSSAALTLDIYSHVLPHMQEEACERVETLLRDPSPLLEVGISTGTLVAMELAGKPS